MLRSGCGPCLLLRQMLRTQPANPQPHLSPTALPDPQANEPRGCARRVRWTRVSVDRFDARLRHDARTEARRSASASPPQIDANGDAHLRARRAVQRRGAAHRRAQQEHPPGEAATQRREEHPRADCAIKFVRVPAALYMGARSGTLFPELDAAERATGRESFELRRGRGSNATARCSRAFAPRLRNSRSRERDLNDALGTARTRRATRLANTRDADQRRQRPAPVSCSRTSTARSRNWSGRSRRLVRRQPKPPPRPRSPAGKHSSVQQQSGGFGNQKAPTNLPAPSGAAAIAVNAAKAQLNKPYQYAAAGPDCFDCSGLTMFAWAQGRRRHVALRSVAVHRVPARADQPAGTGRPRVLRAARSTTSACSSAAAR